MYGWLLINAVQLRENADFVTGRRAQATFSPKDTTAVAAWERALKADGKCPLTRYALLWLAAEERRLQSIEAGRGGNDENDEDDTGKSKKGGKGKAAAKGKANTSDDEDDVADFANLDNDDDDDDVEPPAKKAKAGKAPAAQKKAKKAITTTIEDGAESDDSFEGALGPDDVGDFHLSDFEDEDD
jgi:hypothetical protein